MRENQGAFRPLNEVEGVVRIMRDTDELPDMIYVDSET
jgi:hypothetical protein